MQVEVRRPQPSFAELFSPKLLTVLRESYGFADFRADAVAGLTVAVVALPLSMAIAIACGLGPERGLYTSIVGGFLVSALGGSRFQIGGPAGAFIVLVFSIVQRHGYDGLVVATAMAGVIMMAIGFLRLGVAIKYIPHPVTVGFTSGIALIIFVSQVKEMLGVTLDKEPAAFVPKIEAIAGVIGTIHPATVALTVFSIAVILLVRRFRPTWPAFLVAVIAASVLTAAFHLDVATIGSRFGGIPSGLPTPALPRVDFAMVRELFPDAVAIALLGSIESLLSAVVADSMSGRRHRSNCELVAQGVANIGSVLCGGVCVTGTIARTATNVRAGARGPVSGMLHAVYLLVFMLVAAPLGAYIPLASLGAVLAVVCWNMAEMDEFRALIGTSRGDALVLLSTFLLTVFEDLTLGIAVGVVLAAFLFLHRMAGQVEVAEGGARLGLDDEADDYGGTRTRYDPRAVSDPELMVYKVRGALFFGATSAVSLALDRIGARPRVFALDCAEVSMIDTSAARTLEKFAEKLGRSGCEFWVIGASPSVRRGLLGAGLRRPLAHYASSLDMLHAMRRDREAATA